MRRLRGLGVVAAVTALMVVTGSAITGGAALAQSDTVTIRVGSDDFHDSRLVAEIYAQALEGAGYTVDRHLGLGTRPDRVAAFESGQVDLVPEFVGSGLSYYTSDSAEPELAGLLVSGDGEANRANLQTALDLLGVGATVLSVTPGEDTNAAVVRQDTAAELGLSRMSDLAAVQDDLRWGLPPECDDNPLCRVALERYGIEFPLAQRSSLNACGSEVAIALAFDTIDLGWLCSTQPDIAMNGFVVLDDDLHTQPAEGLAPVVRNDLIAQLDGGVDALAVVLDPISALITTDVLTDLGVKVAVEQQNVAAVAREFLSASAAAG
jgi:osmoprotectant transport system substrate-binding protein